MKTISSSQGGGLISMTAQWCVRSWRSAGTCAVRSADEGGGCEWRPEGGLRSEVAERWLGGRSKACLEIPGCEGWRDRYRCGRIRRSQADGLKPFAVGAQSGRGARPARLAPRGPRPAHLKADLPDAVPAPVPAAHALRGLQCPALRDF